MTASLFVCTDLDRTLMPNGLQPESPEARPLFRVVASKPGVTVAYVSGRSQALQHEAIQRYGLPQPDFAIGDVGTTVYRIHGGRWEPWEDWSREIAQDWQDVRSDELSALVGEPAPLRLQEPERQNDFKLSYYAPADFDARAYREWLQETLAARGAAELRIAVVWSVDETRRLGLLDLIPDRATKLHAVEFLIRALDRDRARTLYAGDSGNDLPVLASSIPSVLVRNAREDVRREALRLAEANRHGARLYLARGGLKGMNGNYAAGLLEGMVHFFPETEHWL